MAVTYAIDGEAGIVRLTLSGKPTFQEWSRAVDALRADAAYRPGYHIISDRSGMDGPPTAGFVREVADYLRARPELRGGRWAIVAPDPAGYGMGRMTEALIQLSGVEARSFHTMGAAVAWLDGKGAGEGAVSAPF